MQLQFKNRVSLNSGERLLGIKLGRTTSRIDVDLLAAEVGDQVFTRVSTVRAGANDGDHVIQMIERGEISFENVLAVFRFGQQISSTPSNDVYPVIDKKLDGLNQAKFFWLPIYDSQE